MKRLWIILALLALGTAGFGQQDPMYSMYMFNGLSINPAYAGSRDALSVMALYRRQWLGIPGAPSTQTFSAHTPDRIKRNGFGFSIINDNISFLGQTWMNVAYAYRIPVGKTGNFSMGLQGTIYNYRINWSKAHLIDPNDVVPSNYGRSLVLPNAGFGIYYYTDKGYAGMSIPHLLVNSLDKSRPGITISEKDVSLAALKRHYFVTAGYVFDLNKFLQFKPSFMYKYVWAAPMEFDINANFYINRKFGVGASYRTGDGVVAMLEFLFTPQLRAGYAYDYPLTQLNGYTSGSHEIMISYEFRFGNTALVSPRVF